MKPLVSIITTTYNAEKFLWESFLSVKWQKSDFGSFINYEWIIIDDGSTDNTVDNIERFLNFIKRKNDNNSYIKFIKNNKNKKIPIRRNEAIDIAEGKYIAIQDADDISTAYRFQYQVNFLEKHDDIFCFGSWAIEINEKGEKIGERNYPPATHNEIVDIITGKETYVLNPIIDPTVMFRREDFIELGKYSLRKDIYTAMDYDLWLRAILRGKKFANLTYPLIYYRKHEDSMTGREKKEMIRAHMIIWTAFMKEYKG